MTYDEFKVLLRAANLTVRELAELLDMSPNSITNYRARGEVPRHLGAIAAMAAALVTAGINVSEVLRRAR